MSELSNQFLAHRLYLIRRAVVRREAAVLDLQAEPESPQHVPGFRPDDEPEVWAVENYEEASLLQLE